MTIGSDEYGRRTLDFVSAIMLATTETEIWALSQSELKWYGLDYLTIWYMPLSRQTISETLCFNSRPEDYTKHYDDKQLVTRDPVVTAMRSTRKSLTWDEVRRRGLSREEQNILAEAIDFGATDGLTIPVVTASGCLGVISPCGFQPNLSERARSAIEIVSLYAHQALQRITPPHSRASHERTPLTAREREIMRWVAMGKTNDEIGSILTIQGSTVKTLLARAQEKLDAVNRTYAVVQAIRTGELDLNF